MGSKARLIGRWAWRISIVLLVIALVQREPDRNLRIAPQRTGPSHSFVFDLFPRILQLFDGVSWASNLGQNYPPHGYFNFSSLCGPNGSTCSQSNPALPANTTGPMEFLVPPTPVDQPIALHEIYEAWINNSANSSPTTTFLMQGVYPIEIGTGCEIFPYFGVAHGFGPGQVSAPLSGLANSNIPIVTPAFGGGHAETRRIDAIVYPGPFGCGSNVAINTCSFTPATSTVTCNVNSNPLVNGQFIQITGSNTAGDNTVGGQTFQLTASSGTSFSFVDSGGGSCGSGCGTASAPYIAGSPPYNLLAGNATVCTGSSTPCLFSQLEQGPGQQTVSWSMLDTYVAVPLIACLYSNGCGIGNSFQ